MLGNIKPRSALTKEQFKPIVDLYEEDRERAEDKLMDFDEDTSWRGYAGYAFDDILTDERHDWCIKYLKDLQWEKQA